MNSEAATPAYGFELLERAITYALGSLSLVTPEAMASPTPCRDWDLAALLAHADDSLSALHEALGTGHVALNEQTAPGDDLVAGVRDRARRLLAACSAPDGDRLIMIDDCPLPIGFLTGTGALEITVHGWDIARSCGHDRPIPPGLAEGILELCPLVVADLDRPARFAAPAEVPPGAGPGDRLIAFLGRPGGGPAPA
ncbi:TIGR03086 family metal-binding protein [Actinomadura sp. 3N508]|uniref:TIGR03086 family metal-binding protein n=1 Tax=Actinomadura sp. 3N508 TaxID=3375153 RepID=UPI0037A8FBB5